MPAHYTLRLQFGWHHDPGATGDRLVRLCAETSVDEVMLFFFAEEMNNGHDTGEEIQRWITWSKPVTEALRGAGVSVSLNPWHSLLHVDRGRELKPAQAHWQRMVDPEGLVATAVVCPLDPYWRAYYRDTLDLYAQAGFDAIWIDDDIRYHNHGNLAWGGCFCPLHLRAFSERVGCDVSRQDLVAACLATGSPHPWRGIWMDLWDEQQTALVASWSDVVVAHGKQLGLMTSLPEQHAAEGRHWKSWFRSLGEKHVLHRPHFWPYTESFGSLLPAAMNIMDQNRSVQPPDISSQPEIECIPYSSWNKSFRQISAQTTMAQVFGAERLQISIYDHMGNDPDIDPSRAAFLKAWRPALDNLADLFPRHLRTQGIRVPWSEDMGRRVHTTEGKSWEELVYPSRGWAAWLGASGLATSVHADGEVTALAGQVIHAFDDDQIAAWLHRGILLDGEAASLLLERGFAKQIGINNISTITQADRPYAVETCIHPGFTSHPGACISVNSEFFTPYGQKLIQGELLPGTFEITELRGPHQQRMGHGITGFINEWGGRVVITPWSANTAPHMNQLRAGQLAKICGFLNAGDVCIQVSGHPWLVPLAMVDDTQWRMAIWNGSADAVTTLTLLIPEDMRDIEQIFVLNAAGEQCAANIQGSEIRLSLPMHSWECVILGGRLSGKVAKSSCH